MGAKWTSETVLELQRAGVLLVEDGNHGEYRPRAEEFVDSGVAFIRAADMSEGRVLFASAAKINPIARQRITKGIGAPGDVLLSHKGTVGKVALVPDEAPEFVCSPQTTFWRSLKPDVLDRGYLHAFLRSPGFHAQLGTRSGETDMAPYVSLTSQRGLVVSFPPITEQRAIAHMLGALDDKIELNRKMNQTLEEMARALFKSWFVDFDPVRAKAAGKKPYGMDDATAALFPDSFENSELGQLPKGWRVATIPQIAAVLSGGTPKTSEPAYWGGHIKWASAKDVSAVGRPFLLSTERTISRAGLENSSTKIVPALATVIVARGATTGRHAMVGDEMAMNQTCYALTSREETPFRLFLLIGTVVERLLSAAHGSVFDTITTRTLEDLKVVAPPGEIGKRFEQIVHPWLECLRQHLYENETLSTLRDTLLPKLLSGELRVAEAEKYAAEVA